VAIEQLELSLDWTTIAVTIAAAASAVVLISVIAGLFGFRANVADALRGRSGAAAPSTNRQTRAALVVVQVAVTVMLVAGAGLFARSLAAALRLNAGIDMSRLVLGTIQLRPYGYTSERAQDFFDRLEARLANGPNVRSVALSIYDGGMTPFGKLRIDGVARQFPSTVWYTRASPEYFRTMRLKLIEGRGFTADDRAGGAPVAIVSASLARLIGGTGRALGRRIDGRSSSEAPVEVVGVVSDIVANVTVLEPLMIYLPIAQGRSQPYRDLVARAADQSRAEDVTREILGAIKELDAQVAPTPLRTLEARVLAQMAPQTVGVTVLGTLGGIAALLTLLGAYVVADSMATSRLREMGIRAALGATRAQLGSIVLADTARLVGAGVVAGLLFGWVGSTTIRSFLFQVQPLDPLTLLLVAVAMMTLALLVSLRGAQRVARVNLSSVLKAE
jgi:hypothetical protein